VKDAAGTSTALDSFLPVTVPPAETWLDEQKNAFRARREQVYAANRQGEGWAAIGGNTFQSVTQTHYYNLNQTVTNTGTRQLVVNSQTGDAASISVPTQFTSVRAAARHGAPAEPRSEPRRDRRRSLGPRQPPTHCVRNS